MGPRPLLSFAISALAGCSIIYNPDNLPPLTDADIDAPTDAPFDAPTDSNPELLEITGVTPSTIDEGVGSGGSRPVVFQLEGEAIVGSATVTVDLMGATETATLIDFDATPDGTKGGAIVRIPVMTGLAAGMTRTLRITVQQGNVTKMADVTVNGLDELVVNTTPRTTVVNPPTYSTITVSSNVHFTGAEPVILKATANIDIQRALDANAAGSTAGPHGCNGGVMEAAGGCGIGTGGPGSNASILGVNAGSGGGGGGFGQPGTIGGANGGAPGQPTGNEALVPIITSPGTAGNRGNGGAGGGGGLLGAAGGPGGGGGGVVWIQAGGDITVGAMGTIEARGATTSGGSGGGGGGSGGAILVRAGGSITSTTRWLSAPGGGASTGSSNPGGPGGAGRIRIDTPAGDIASMSNNPNAWRGPSWATDTPSLTSTGTLTFGFHGEPGREFSLRLNDQPLTQTATPGSGGDVDVPGIVLRPGKNRLCGVALTGSLQGAESQSCIELFYAGN
ncbi:MAG TPA: hypothetical protein VM261_06405 [Kofleriaceae bacterium]|nr:hypothetical protein [Kofleriaceae bacterium]